jgi:hypothetical protein
MKSSRLILALVALVALGACADSRDPVAPADPSFDSGSVIGSGNRDGTGGTTTTQPATAPTDTTTKK